MGSKGRDDKTWAAGRRRRRSPPTAGGKGSRAAGSTSAASISGGAAGRCKQRSRSLTLALPLARRSPASLLAALAADREPSILNRAGVCGLGPCRRGGLGARPRQALAVRSGPCNVHRACCEPVVNAQPAIEQSATRLQRGRAKTSDYGVRRLAEPRNLAVGCLRSHLRSPGDRRERGVATPPPSTSGGAARRRRQPRWHCSNQWACLPVLPPALQCSRHPTQQVATHASVWRHARAGGCLMRRWGHAHGGHGSSSGSPACDPWAWHRQDRPPARPAPSRVGLHCMAAHAPAPQLSTRAAAPWTHDALVGTVSGPRGSHIAAPPATRARMSLEQQGPHLSPAGADQAAALPAAAGSTPRPASRHPGPSTPSPAYTQRRAVSATSCRLAGLSCHRLQACWGPSAPLLPAPTRAGCRRVASPRRRRRPPPSALQVRRSLGPLQAAWMASISCQGPASGWPQAAHRCSW